MMKKIFYVAIVVIAVVVVLGVSSRGIPLENRRSDPKWMPLTSPAWLRVRMALSPGVWVNRETKDLGTGFRKIVVTDDQGRYLVPIFLRRTTRFGCAAMVWWIRQKVSGHPRQATGLKAVIGSSPEGSGAILSGRLLVLIVAYPAEERLPRHWNRTGTASQNALGTGRVD